MKKISITTLIISFGVVLILTGVIAFLVTGTGSITALIPAFVGIPMLVAGFATSNNKYRRWGLYAAAGLALLMIIGSVRGITSFISGIFGKGEIGAATWLQVVLVILSIIFLVISLRITLVERKLKA